MRASFKGVAAGVVAAACLLAYGVLTAEVIAQPPVASGTPRSGVVRDVARGDQSNIDSRREVVVRTQREWTALWRAHDFDRDVPRVDFSREMIAAVFLGSQTTAGFAVRVVESVTTERGDLVVRYQVDRPAPTAVAAQVLTFPYHIVALPARTGTVRFERVE